MERSGVLERIEIRKPRGGLDKVGRPACEERFGSMLPTSMLGSADADVVGSRQVLRTSYNCTLAWRGFATATWRKKRVGRGHLTSEQPKQAGLAGQPPRHPPRPPRHRTPRHGLGRLGFAPSGLGRAGEAAWLSTQALLAGSQRPILEFGRDYWLDVQPHFASSSFALASNLSNSVSYNPFVLKN